ncbi:hypothetical protein PPERSA_01121 [Pseudocohnilembus persalinus]|uniref:Uncharacterized protein n=1 Tax=Pseudocohnilembus persalinus TaxID=266149 RepID=A0A0V0QUX1_PSEPJ|nr:hypothetical protein PPERSA_01121 [Pseudocohnilembus persalinus]|eukprot:KRX06043.1 hypothetical protein PPERSA_01121 [Pseudocohnilembus persalinus]
MSQLYFKQPNNSYLNTKQNNGSSKEHLQQKDQYENKNYSRPRQNPYLKKIYKSQVLVQDQENKGKKIYPYENQKMIVSIHSEHQNQQNQKIKQNSNNQEQNRYQSQQISLKSSSQSIISPLLNQTYDKYFSQTQIQCQSDQKYQNNRILQQEDQSIHAKEKSQKNCKIFLITEENSVEQTPINYFKNQKSHYNLQDNLNQKNSFSAFADLNKINSQFYQNNFNSEQKIQNSLKKSKDEFEFKSDSNKNMQNTQQYEQIQNFSQILGQQYGNQSNLKKEQDNINLNIPQFQKQEVVKLQEQNQNNRQMYQRSFRGAKTNLQNSSQNTQNQQCQKNLTQLYSPNIDINPEKEKQIQQKDMQNIFQTSQNSIVINESIFYTQNQSYYNTKDSNYLDQNMQINNSQDYSKNNLIKLQKCETFDQKMFLTNQKQQDSSRLSINNKNIKKQVNSQLNLDKYFDQETLFNQNQNQQKQKSSFHNYNQQVMNNHRSNSYVQEQQVKTEQEKINVLSKTSKYFIERTENALKNINPQQKQKNQQNQQKEKSKHRLINILGGSQQNIQNKSNQSSFHNQTNNLSRQKGSKRNSQLNIKQQQQQNNKQNFSKSKQQIQIHHQNQNQNINTRSSNIISSQPNSPKKNQKISNIKQSVQKQCDNKYLTQASIQSKYSQENIQQIQQNEYQNKQLYNSQLSEHTKFDLPQKIDTQSQHDIILTDQNKQLKKQNNIDKVTSYTQIDAEPIQTTKNSQKTQNRLQQNLRPSLENLNQNLQVNLEIKQLSQSKTPSLAQRNAQPQMQSLAENYVTANEQQKINTSIDKYKQPVSLTNIRQNSKNREQKQNSQYASFKQKNPFSSYTSKQVSKKSSIDQNTINNYGINQMNRNLNMNFQSPQMNNQILQQLKQQFKSQQYKSERLYNEKVKYLAQQQFPDSLNLNSAQNNQIQNLNQNENENFDKNINFGDKKINSQKSNDVSNKNISPRSRKQSQKDIEIKNQFGSQENTNYLNTILNNYDLNQKNNQNNQQFNINENQKIFSQNQTQNSANLNNSSCNNQNYYKDRKYDRPWLANANPNYINQNSYKKIEDLGFATTLEKRINDEDQIKEDKQNQVYKNDSQKNCNKQPNFNQNFYKVFSPQNQERIQNKNSIPISIHKNKPSNQVYQQPTIIEYVTKINQNDLFDHLDCCQHFCFLLKQISKQNLYFYYDTETEQYYKIKPNNFAEHSKQESNNIISDQKKQ